MIWYVHNDASEYIFSSWVQCALCVCVCVCVAADKLVNIDIPISRSDFQCICDIFFHRIYHFLMNETHLLRPVIDGVVTSEDIKTDRSWTVKNSTCLSRFSTSLITPVYTPGDCFMHQTPH